MSENQSPLKPKKKKKRKKLKGKAAKRAMSQAERLEKYRKWVEAYAGDNLLKDYRKKFATDRMQTIDDLQKLGVAISPEQITQEKRAVQAHQQQLKRRKAKRRARRRAKQAEPLLFHENQSDTFFYIAGYTSGGAPYGVTWEEMGLEPWESLDRLDSKPLEDD